MSTPQPSALAPSAAPFDGTWLLIDACPAEMTTTFLPLTAGRLVGSTGRFVPFIACAVASLAFWSPSAGADPVALMGAVESVEVPPHAAVTRTAATARASAPKRG